MSLEKYTEILLVSYAWRYDFGFISSTTDLKTNSLLTRKSNVVLVSAGVWLFFLSVQYDVTFWFQKKTKVDNTLPFLVGKVIEIKTLLLSCGSLRS